MRILHISTRLILGGSQENTVLSCEEQVRRGHEVHLAFGPIYGPEGSMLDRIHRFHASQTGDSKIGLHHVQNLVREVNPLKDWRAVGEVERLIEKINPDVVHTHSSKAGIVGRRAAWNVKQRNGGRPRVVHTIHGPPFMPVEGSWLRQRRTRMVNWLYTLAERDAARRCDAIVSVADAMTEQFLARGIGSPTLYTTVRSGVEVERYADLAADRSAIRRRLGVDGSEQGVVIGTVARLAEHKGHDDLLDVLSDLLKTHPKWRMVWVGDGWWRERLVRRAQQEKKLVVCQLDRGEQATPATQLILTGLVSPEAVPVWMSSMDVLVHPSMREGLPRTVVQALLAGACPVAYDVDGTREVCIDGETGRLIAAGDVAGLREAVKELAENGEKRKDLASRGRALVVGEFSVAAMCDGLERVYNGTRGGGDA